METKDKHPGGRPLKGLDTLPDGWKKQAISLYSEGASDVEFKAWVYSQGCTLSNTLWDRWMLEEQEFSETIKRGRLLSQSWWERKGRVNLADRDFNYTGWYMNMKNRFNWRDKQDITSDDKPINEVKVNFNNYK